MVAIGAILLALLIGALGLPSSRVREEGTARQRRQVFVLRHCVRSTSPKVKYGVPGITDANAYTNASLPAWGVPDNWCTPGGLAILEGTGSYLARSGAVPSDASISVVADTVQRDVDSAVALLRGMGRGEGVSTDATLFDTLDPDVGAPLCDSTDTDEQREHAARQRMHDVPYPADFDESTALLERLVGVGTAGPLAPMGPPALTSDGKLTGAIGPLKLFSQNLFYSFASAIPYAWQRASAAELYQLLGWQHYLRSVTDMHEDKATENAALLHRLLAALEDGAPDAPDATLLFGHDGNLDGLALLLGLRWMIPPYVGTPELIPTPPGSGLRFEMAPDGAQDGALTISFVYPVYTAADGRVNSSGILEAAPVISVAGELPATLDALRARVAEGLGAHDDAKRCYERARATRS